MNKTITKKYSNGEIIVKWQPGLCIHSTSCVKGLPSVFDVNKKPWINIEGADSDSIIRQVNKCPSGALAIEGKQEKIALKDDSLVADNKPHLIDLEENKNYAWCACGRSKNQPWCDGSHKITSIKPIIFTVANSGKKALCMCKQTSGQPYCDGTHNGLSK